MDDFFPGIFTGFALGLFFGMLGMTLWNEAPEVPPYHETVSTSQSLVRIFQDAEGGRFLTYKDAHGNRVVLRVALPRINAPAAQIPQPQKATQL